MKIRAHVFFDGLVQGVFFRSNTKKCADRLGLTGWVRNVMDGRVEAVFEGEEENVRAAIEWCATRQPYADVRAKEVEFLEYTGEFRSFSIVP
jgi:acylphosphatase